MFGGVDPTTLEPIPGMESVLCSQMRAAAKGVEVKLRTGPDRMLEVRKALYNGAAWPDATLSPAPSHHATFTVLRARARLRQDRILKVYTTNTSCDFITHAELGVECSSAAASLFCRGCDFNQYVADDKPFSFLSPSSGVKRGRCAPKERDLDTVLSQLEQLAKCTTQRARDQFTKMTGIKRTHSPLLPKVLPGFNLTTMRPQDATHLEGCGLLRDEFGKLIHNLVKINKLFTLPQYEARRLR